MKLSRLARHYRSGQRLRHILMVLARHGYGHFIERLHLAEHVPLLGRIMRREPGVAELTIPRRLVHVLQELGPTFVKLGQMLSGRPDLLPREYIDELKKLRDHVDPFPSEQARAAVAAELGRPIEEVFEEFVDVPLASGSIAQVHEAVTRNGHRVVVKVKRPGIERVIMTDIDLLTDLAELAERHIPELNVLRPKMLVEEFQRGVRREMNFITEASYTARFAEIHADNDRIIIPRVYWDYTTDSVLTLGKITGTPITNIEELRRKGMDLPELARIGADAFMKQYFDEGMFHADPHGGNILVTDDGRLGIIDFGLVGHLSEHMTGQLATILITRVYGDISLMADVATEIGIFSEVEDVESLRADLKELAERYYGLPLKHIDVRKLFLELMDMARQYQVTMPREFVMLGRSFATIDSVGRELDPDFDISQAIEPYVRGMIRNKLSPRNLVRNASMGLWQVTRLLQEAPKTIRRFGDKLLAGKLSVALKHEGLQSFTLELEKSSNRLAFSILVAAIIVASSLILSAKIGPMWGNVSLLGLAGYALAALLGFWLLIAILRSGRM